MRTHSGRWSALTVAALLVGCGQPVREDRSISFDASGRRVAFQHGREGVFVADGDGGGVRKIFQPGADDIAVGAPLWEPDGRRVLFATARADDRPQQRPPAPRRGEDDPAGNVHVKRPVVYTCWLHDDAGGAAAAPRRLFEARCDHVGYVAATLALAWHPQGRSVLYVDRVGEERHSLFEYDLEAGRPHRALPHDAEALVFAWSPDGSRLACVLGGESPRPETDGIWVGRPGPDGWRRVPHFDRPPPAELPSTLEQLRAALPAWTRDGGRLAFVSYSPGKGNDEPGRHALHTASAAAQDVETLAEGPEPFRDLHWSPDGGCLGCVRGRGDGALYLLRPGETAKPALPGPVRRFVGWDAGGGRLAYVAPDALPNTGAGSAWALLLTPDPQSRDALCVADGAEAQEGQTVFAGMRVTFARWSPTEEKLSLWATYTPTHRSLPSALLGAGLRPGDPAAVFDLKTRRLSWMPVSPEEKVQVGHSFLLRRDLDAAWRWYEEAEREEGRPEPRPVRDAAEARERLNSLRHPGCFHYYCLEKLGRKDEARARLDQFLAAYPPRFAPLPKGQEAGDAERSLRERLSEGGLSFHLLQDFYLAEMFLSLDAAEDGAAFFRSRLEEGRTDAARLSAALALSQLLLIQKRYEDYAELATKTAAPLLLDAVQAGGDDELLASMETIGMLALAPLTAPDFLTELPEGRVESLLLRWSRLREQARTERARCGVDLVLCALYGRLGRDRERLAAEGRLERAAKTLADAPGLQAVRAWHERRRQAGR
jgi:hypothetical protein